MPTKRSTVASALAGFLVAIFSLPLFAQDWRTDYEKSGYQQSPPYAQTIAYCKRLAAASPWIHYTTFGTSPQGRDLALLVVDRKKRFTAERVRRSDNVVFLIQAGIHAGEIDGKDAGLMLVREIAISKQYEHLLDHATILFMPIFNVDGHENASPYNRINQNGPEVMGFRTNARNLNLNRDYLKVDSPEMRAWVELYVEWLPEFFADCHVTDGADYQYPITYALEIFGNMDPGLTAYARDTYQPFLEEALAASGHPTTRYLTFTTRHEPRSGLDSWAAPPRFSGGYTTIHNRLGMLIETHMLKDYKTRVDATYEMLRHTLVILNRDYKIIRRLSREADHRSASAAFRAEPYPLAFQTAADTSWIEYLGIDYQVVDSELTGGKWHQYNGRPTREQIPYFDTQEPTRTAQLPEGYIVPPEWVNVIDRIAWHGVTFTRLAEERTVAVHSYRLEDPTWMSRPYEGRHRMSHRQVDTSETRTFPAGSIVIDMNQRAAQVAAHILEPQAPDSYAHWGFFNSAMEQKEYVESYVIEKMAREMLAKDEGLKEEFEAALAADSTFAGNTRRIRNWFYRRTPYYRDRAGVYPVGKIMDREVLNDLID